MPQPHQLVSKIGVTIKGTQYKAVTVAQAKKAAERARARAAKAEGEARAAA